MKKHLISLALAVLVSAAASAQLEAGYLMLGTSTSVLGSGGNAGGFLVQTQKYSIEELDELEYDVFAFNLTPRMGYFLADGLMAGVMLDLNHYQRHHDVLFGSGEEYKMNNVVAGPFFRYYFGAKGEGRLKPYLEAEGMAGRESFSMEEDSKYKTNIYQFGGGLGAAVLLNKHLTFDMLAGISYIVRQDSEAENDEKLISNNLGLSLGFSYFLSK